MYCFRRRYYDLLVGRKEGKDRVLYRFQQLRSYCDDMETRIPFSSLELKGQSVNDPLNHIARVILYYNRKLSALQPTACTSNEDS